MTRRSPSSTTFKVIVGGRGDSTDSRICRRCSGLIVASPRIPSIAPRSYASPVRSRLCDQASQQEPRRRSRGRGSWLFVAVMFEELLRSREDELPVRQQSEERVIARDLADVATVDRCTRALRTDPRVALDLAFTVDEQDPLLRAVGA